MIIIDKNVDCGVRKNAKLCLYFNKKYHKHGIITQYLEAPKNTIGPILKVVLLCS